MAREGGKAHSECVVDCHNSDHNDIIAAMLKILRPSTISLCAYKM